MGLRAGAADKKAHPKTMIHKYRQGCQEPARNPTETRIHPPIPDTPPSHPNPTTPPPTKNADNEHYVKYNGGDH